MKAGKITGIINAALSSSTFGLAPMFSLLLLAADFSPFEVLTYRWGVASLALAVFGLLTGRSFAVRRNQIPSLLLLCLFRASTSLALIFAYKNIASGVASSIHFMYPLFVSAVMMVFYREDRSPSVVLALLASVAGALLLSSEDIAGADGNVKTGLFCSFLSILTYGAYIIGVRKTRVSDIDSVALTTYVMGIGAVLYFIGAQIFGSGVRFVPFTDVRLWLCIAGLALPATAISNMTLVYAVRQAGPTLTSILGALEPLTAVLAGAALFDEPFTVRTVLGMLMILFGVTLAVLRRTGK